MLTAIDLFCGVGGFTRGFKDVGFTVLLGVEKNQTIATTFHMNFPESIVLVEDVQEIHSIEIERLVGMPDVVIGSPPCEAFTRANPKRKKNPIDRLYSDPTGSLILDFIRIVGDLKPKIFVMENVPGILEGELKDAIKYEFSQVGYKEIFFNILFAEDYCTPSHRRRVFISNIPIKPPKCNKIITVWDAIKDLPPPGSIHDIPNHIPITLSPRKLRRISKLRWGEGLIKYVGSNKIYANLVRLHPYKIAPTVMGSSRFIHPFENRLLTVREQARLMGFPDDHIFYGGYELQYNTIGEAVPVTLARAIAKVVKSNIT